MSTYDQSDSAGTFHHHPGLQGVRRKVVPRRVETQREVPGTAAGYYGSAQDQTWQDQDLAYHQNTAGASTQQFVAPSPIYYLGAALSLAMIVGVGVWGYQIAMRDVNGIPVVKALDIPGRIQPADPGGRQAAHQGLAVNEVQANSEATATADRLILAPPPIGLIEGDSPVAEFVPAVARLTVPTTPQRDLNNDIQLAVASAVAQVGGADQVTSASTGSQRISTSISGVSTSKVPMLRPNLDLASYDRLANNAATSVVTSTTPARTASVSGVDLDPGLVTVGTKLVQIGAFDSEAGARAEWDRLAAQFEDVFAGKQRLIQSASHSGRNFYRLRVHGFDDSSQSGQFCSEMIARSVICIPVEIR